MNISNKFFMAAYATIVFSAVALQAGQNEDNNTQTFDFAHYYSIGKAKGSQLLTQAKAFPVKDTYAQVQDAYQQAQQEAKSVFTKVETNCPHAVELGAAACGGAALSNYKNAMVARFSRLSKFEKFAKMTRPELAKHLRRVGSRNVVLGGLLLGANAVYQNSQKSVARKVLIEMATEVNNNGPLLSEQLEVIGKAIKGEPAKDLAKENERRTSFVEA